MPKSRGNIFKNFFLVLLIVITFANTVVFFYIKNSTYYLKNKIDQLSNDVIAERHNLLIKQAEFNKDYNIENLQGLAKNRLDLQFSNVNQIESFEDIIDR